MIEERKRKDLLIYHLRKDLAIFFINMQLGAINILAENQVFWSSWCTDSTLEKNGGKNDEKKRKKDARFLKAATFYQFMYRNHQKGLNLYFCRTGKQNNGGSVTYFNDFFLPVLDLSYLIL